jgi:hypothetical protein
MNAIYNFIEGWKDLFIKIWSEYPLAGAFITVLVICAFVVCERSKYGRWPPPVLHMFIALIAWCVLVPILGLLLSLLLKIGEWLGAGVSFLWRVGSFIFGVYQAHPLFVLILAVLAVVVCWIWHWRRPTGMSVNWQTKALICCAAFVVSVALGAPIINLLSPSTPTVSDAKHEH